MKINDDHMYHGAALTQIAEHPEFTAINVFRDNNGISRSAFRINDDIGVFLKYASNPKPPHGEYQFEFLTEHLDELEEMAARVSGIFVALVCVAGRHICCLPYSDLCKLVRRRRSARGYDEDHYTILVTLPPGKAFRVYVNAPGVKNTMQGKPILIRRSDFPDALFG